MESTGHSIRVDKLQIREVIRKQSEDIITKARNVDEVISTLFSTHTIGIHDKDNLESHTPEDKVSHLVELILLDDTGGKAEEFLQALFTNHNETLADIIVTEAGKNNKKWLEIQQMGRDLIQEHNEKLTTYLRDVNPLIDRLQSDGVISSCKAQSSPLKIKRILRQLHFADIGKILCFVNHLQHSKNDALFRILLNSEKMIAIQERIDGVFKDMLSDTKQRLFTKLRNIIPIPGRSFNLDMMRDRTRLLRLGAVLHLPKCSHLEGEWGSTRGDWKCGEDKYKITDADRLFSDNTHKVVLVEGNPGSGKTVFLQRWAMDWAANQQENPDSFVIYITIRDVQSQNLFDIIFEDLMLIGKEYRPALEYFMQHEKFQSQFRFLVDGMDEKMATIEKTDIFKVIEGIKLPESKVVFTTRMYQTVLEKLKPFSDVVVTLNGVTDQSREVFIHHMLGGQADANDVQAFLVRCKKFLLDHKILAVPIYLTLLCVLAQEHCSENKLETLNAPRTRLEMYDTFADVFEKRYNARTEVDSSEVMGKKSLSLLKHLLGRMSFYNLALEKYVFNMRDFEENFLEESQIQKIGYFIEVTGCTDDKVGGQPVYSFSHKTFQEYFAGIFCAKIGFPKTAMHLMTQETGIFKNSRIWDGLENVCIRREWEVPKLESARGDTKTMEESFQQLVTAIQFASGMSSNFAKDVFLYGICACDLKVSRNKNNKRLFDTHFESALVFESQDRNLVECYARYLLMVKKNEVSGIQSDMPDNYRKAVYEYISKTMPSRLKCRLLNELYEVKSEVYSNGNRQDIITESGKSKSEDMLESNLLGNQLPTVVSVSGAEVDVQLLTSALSQTDKLTCLEIRNNDLSSVRQTVWDQLLDILQRQPMLTQLMLPFCNLQPYQLKDLFMHLSLEHNLKYIDLSGNNLSALTESLLDNIAPVFTKQNTLSICHNFVVNQDLSSTKGGIDVVYSKVYVDSFAKFLTSNSFLKALSIDQSFLGDSVCENGWELAMRKLQSCDELEKLKLTACKISEDFHMTGLAAVIGSAKTLQVLDLSQNDFCDIKSVTWARFIQSLSVMNSLRHLHLSKCCLLRSYHMKHLGNAFATLARLVTLNMSRNAFGNCNEDEVVCFLSSLRKLVCLEVLDLSKCELHRTTFLIAIGNALCGMKNIRTISLSGNGFEKMDNSSWVKFIHFSENANHLHDLNLSKCKLSKSYQVECLTQLVTNCGGLETMDISHNDFSKIDEGIWDSFCGVLYQNGKLQSINLTNCHLNMSHHVKSLAATIKQSCNLKLVHLAKNRMRNVESNDWQIFLEALSHTSVERLNLSKCYLQSSHFKNNSTCMAELQNLLQLEMPHNTLGILSIFDWNMFVLSLAKCQKLQYLKLSKNSLSGVHLACLGKTLRMLCGTLVHLNLDDNNIGVGKDEEWEIFTKELAHCTHIKKLAVSKCKIWKDTQISKLANCIGQLQELDHLDISQNDLRDVNNTTWGNFTDNLKRCRALDKLNLYNCKLHGRFQFQSLGSILPCFSKLRRINISGNDISDVDSWQFMWQGLRNCKQLQYIKASNCNITSESHIDAMIPVVRSSPMLTEVEMSHNQLSINSYKKLIKTLGQCTQLRKIDLRECHSQVGKDLSKWHAGEDGTTVKLFTKYVLEQLSKLASMP